MSHYPPGTMRGSGIYQTSTILPYVECHEETILNSVDDYAECGYQGPVDAELNDWKTGGVWQCPNCSTENDFDTADFFDPYDYEDYDR